VEFQQVINVIIGLAISAVGWWCRQIWDSIQDLKNDVKRIEIDLPHYYVTKDDYKDDIAEVKKILNEIFQELKTKADK
jgi:hypothetical protein